MKKKERILAIVAVVLIAAICVGAWFITRPDTNEGKKTFTVTVVHGDGTTKEFTYTSAELYVGTVVQAEGLVKGEMGDYGLYIHEVDGERAVWEENGAYWGFYVNGEYAATGIDLTPITDGDTYQLKYTTE